MKSLMSTWTGVAAFLSTTASSAQTGHMMNGGGMSGGGSMGGGWMGGYGGYWGPILLVALIGVVIWAVLKRRK